MKTIEKKMFSNSEFLQCTLGENSILLSKIDKMWVNNRQSVDYRVMKIFS